MINQSDEFWIIPSYEFYYWSRNKTNNIKYIKTYFINWISHLHYQNLVPFERALVSIKKKTLFLQSVKDASPILLGTFLEQYFFDVT